MRLNVNTCDFYKTSHQPTLVKHQQFITLQLYHLTPKEYQEGVSTTTAIVQ
jgi:hypothetical protein